jgi:hypothetical protein
MQRRHTLKIGDRLRDAAAVKPVAAASAITLTVDSTFIRSCDNGERHLEVRVGNVETSDGKRQVFGFVARSDTSIAALIRRNLETAGCTGETAVTAFTDGCTGLQLMLAEAGITTPPIAGSISPCDCSTRSKQRAGYQLTSLAGPKPRQRSSWRACTGRFGTARPGMPSSRSSGSARSCMSFRGERGHRRKGVPSRKLPTHRCVVSSFSSQISRYLPCDCLRTR